MEWWQEVLMWTGGVTWFLVAWVTAVALMTKRKEEQEEVEDFHLEDYVWVHANNKPPIRVPKELAERAMELMDRDSTEDFLTATPPQYYTVPLANIRAAMAIAQEEPDLEVALATWLANYIRMTPGND